MRNTYASALVLGLLASSCGTDVATPSSLSENGRWVVISATRGGRETNTLDAAYFEFDTAKHQMITNFIGEELTLDYIRDNQLVTTKGSALINQFSIGELTDSTLAMATEIRGTEFTFLLKPESQQTMEGLPENEALPDNPQ